MRHFTVVMKEQMEHIKKQDKEILSLEKFWYIIFNGKYQSALVLSHFITNSKNERSRTLKTRLIGLLEHKKPANLYLYTTTKKQEPGASHVLETMHRFISDLAASGQLPPTLYVQVKNCTKGDEIDTCLRVWSLLWHGKYSTLLMFSLGNWAYLQR